MNETASTTMPDVSDEPRKAATSDTLPTLPDKVAGLLRDMIVQDVLVPGQRIRERSLAEQLEVSRTPLREAMKVLATEGLVELSPNRGALVASPSPQQVQDMLQVLGVLEGLAGELACARASQDQIDEIQALHYEMLASYARKDRLGYFKLNQKIHQAIVAASGNVSLIETRPAQCQALPLPLPVQPAQHDLADRHRRTRDDPGRADAARRRRPLAAHARPPGQHLGEGQQDHGRGQSAGHGGRGRDGTRRVLMVLGRASANRLRDLAGRS